MGESISTTAILLMIGDICDIGIYYLDNLGEYLYETHKESIFG